MTENARTLVARVRDQLAAFDWLSPGGWLPPRPPLRRTWWGRWVPINVSMSLEEWAGEIARKRVLMDLDSIIAMLPHSFQARVALWMHQCFGPIISADRVERGDRLLEEVLELLQSGGYDRERVAALVEYVYGRPAGEPSQEVGGVMVTLAAYCQAFGLDMEAAGETELERVFAPEMVAKIRAKQAAKAKAIPFSPLPQAEGAQDGR